MYGSDYCCFLQIMKATMIEDLINYITNRMNQDI